MISLRNFGVRAKTRSPGGDASRLSAWGLEAETCGAPAPASDPVHENKPKPNALRAAGASPQNDEKQKTRVGGSQGLSREAAVRAGDHRHPPAKIEGGVYSPTAGLAVKFIARTAQTVKTGRWLSAAHRAAPGENLPPGSARSSNSMHRALGAQVEHQNPRDNQRQTQDCRSVQTLAVHKPCDGGYQRNARA
jgi:hypothetical protein